MKISTIAMMANILTADAFESNAPVALRSSNASVASLTSHVDPKVEVSSMKGNGRKLSDGWTQLGSQIVHTDRHLNRIVMTADGLTLVAGANRYFHVSRMVETWPYPVLKTFNDNDWVELDPNASIGEGNHKQGPLPSISGDGNVLGLQHGDRKKGYFWDDENSRFIAPYTFLGTHTSPWCHKISKDGSTFFFITRSPPNDAIWSYVFRYDGSAWIEEASWINHNGHYADLCDVSADGNRVVSGVWGYGSTAIFHQYNLESKSWERVAVPDNNLPVASIAMSEDGSRVVAHRKIGYDSYGSEVYNWNYDLKKIESSGKTFDDGRTLNSGSTTNPFSLAMSHDGKRIASKATQDGGNPASWVKVFEEGETSWDQILYIPTAAFQWGDYGDGVALNCDGTVLAYAEDNKITVRRDDAGTNTSSCPESSLGGTSQGVTAWSQITDSPTGRPTKQPTDSPSRTPWEITHDDSTTVVDFSHDSSAGVTGVSAGDEGVITTKYDATAASDNARLETFLVNEVCAATSSGGPDKDKIPSEGTCSVTGSSTATDCTYRFEKTNFITSFNFNTGDNKLKVCEVARLSLPRAAAGEDDLVIEEYFTNVEVTFNMTQGFDVEAVSMEKANIQSSTQETSLSDYISASQCDGPTTQLAPNDVLCIQIASSSPDVLIVSIDEMDIAGKNSLGGEATLEVYDNKAIKYTAITSETDSPVDNGPAGQRVEVRTRVPTSTFNFEATDAKINITGSVTVQFAGSRRLVSVDLDRLLQANEGEETAEFGTTVNLASEPKLALEDGDAMMNSAKAMKAFATFGMVFAFTFALW